ncbi:MAG: hypothetical protein SRB2_04871 [Desulfobacteraceae bacterium Eth-SRB2]|nr:MAG: hypothetical protein SRB2_04871 [Desulfobacteraceae bacterium Eth-SRB2]
MKKRELKAIAIKGEDSHLQFKQDIRNPILVSYIAKGLLLYRGLGSGIKRALEAWPEIDFADDRDGCLFTATVHRKAVKSSGKTSGKTKEHIIALLRELSAATIPELADKFGVTTRAVEKQIAKLKESGRLRRIGPAKGGHWEVQ